MNIINSAREVLDRYRQHQRERALQSRSRILDNRIYGSRTERERLERLQRESLPLPISIEPGRVTYVTATEVHERWRGVEQLTIEQIRNAFRLSEPSSLDWGEIHQDMRRYFSDKPRYEPMIQEPFDPELSAWTG